MLMLMHLSRFGRISVVSMVLLAVAFLNCECRRPGRVATCLARQRAGRNVGLDGHDGANSTRRSQTDHASFERPQAND